MTPIRHFGTSNRITPSNRVPLGLALGGEAGEAEDDNLILQPFVADCLRLVVVLTTAHIARSSYEGNPMFGKDFFHGMLFFMFGTAIYYTFFRRHCNMIEKNVPVMQKHFWRLTGSDI